MLLFLSRVHYFILRMQGLGVIYQWEEFRWFPASLGDDESQAKFSLPNLNSFCHSADYLFIIILLEKFVLELYLPFYFI